MDVNKIDHFKETLDIFLSNLTAFNSNIAGENEKELPDVRKIAVCCQTMSQMSDIVYRMCHAIMSDVLSDIFDPPTEEESSEPPQRESRRSYICSRTGTKIFFIDGSREDDPHRLFEEGWTFKTPGGWQVGEQE